MTKKVLSLILAICMVVGLLPAVALPAAAAEVASGTSGNVSWTLTDDGTLTFSGEGAIGNDQSWIEHMDLITSIVIEEGITTIGNYAFYECTGFESVTLPASLTTIGNYAFTNCSDLKSVTIPASVTKIGNSAFYRCTSLATVNYLGMSEPASVGSYVFAGCALMTVNVPVAYEGDTFAGLNVSKTLVPAPPCDHAGHTQSGCSCGLSDSSIHTFTESSNGFCDVCDGYEVPTLNSDGYYEIDNAGKLYWFAAYVNAGNVGANAKLTANITITSSPYGTRHWTPIGNISNQYTGTFDGQNHTIADLYFYDSEAENVGLFGCVGVGGKVMNVGVIGSTFSGARYVGGVVGYNEGTVVSCYNTGKVTAPQTGDVGGVVGGNNGGTVVSCYNTGKVTAPQTGDVGGVVGTNNNGTVQNCYNTGSVSGNIKVGGVLGKNSTSGTVTNCYFNSDNYSGNAIGLNDGGTVDALTTGKTAAQFASGEVAYLLGDAFGQTIGTDTVPVFATGSNKVYATGVCSSTTYTYTNTEGTVTHDATLITADSFEEKDGALYCKLCGAQAVASLTYGDTVTYYVDLQKAVTAAETANGSTVKLLDYVLLPSETPIQIMGGTFTFDLNGQTLRSDDYIALWIRGAATVTLMDSAGGGSIESGDDGGAAVTNFSAGTLIIESGTVKGAYEAVSNNGTLTVTGGTFEAPYTALYIGGGTARIEGGTVVGNVFGFESYTITGGTFTGDYIGINKAGGKVSIEGGTFDIDELRIISGEISVTGGSFAIDPSAHVPAGYAVTNADGYYTVSLCTAHNWVGGACTLCGTVCAHEAYTYAAAGSTVTATCTDCDYSGSITVAAQGKTYDGTPVVATLTGSIVGVATPEITYSGNTDAGTYAASITVGGVTAAATFTIDPAEITADMITVANATYDGTAKNPTDYVTVTVGGVELICNKHYYIGVDPEDYINAGTEYPIRIVGQGNYTGEVELTFTIEKATLTEADVTVENLNPTFDFDPQPVTVTRPTGLEEQYVTVGYLKDGSPLEGAPTDAGTYRVLVMVSGSPNYEDATFEYQLVIAPAAVTVEIMDLTAQFFYTGQAHTPKVVVTINGGLPFGPAEFGGIVTHTDNTAVGTATVTVTGNFTGTCTFEIQKGKPTISLESPLDQVMPGYVLELTGKTTALDNAFDPTTFTILPGEGYTVNGMQITINEGVLIGSTITVKVVSSETANYQAAEGELTLTIGVPTVDTAELEAKIAALEKAIEELKNTHGADVSALEAQLQQLKDQLAVLDGTFATDAELADAIAAVNQTISDLADRVATLEATYATKAELEAAIEALEALIAQGDQANADALTAAVAELEKALADAVAALEQADADNKAALEALINEAKTALETALAALEERVEKNETDIAALQEALAKAIEDLNKAIAAGDATNAEALAEAVAKLEKALADAVAALETADAENKAALEKMISEAEAALEAALAALEERVEKNETDIAALQAALQKAIDELNAAIADGDAANAEALAEAVATLEKALADAVAALEQADADNKAALEKMISEAEAALEAALAALEERVEKNETDIAALQAALQKAIEDLNKAIADGDAANAEALAEAVAKLEKALADAVAALEQADADNKTALEALINEAKTALETAITQLRQDLEDAVADLENADKENAEALAQAIKDLSAAIEAAKAVSAAEDAKIRAELAAAQAALQSAISSLSAQLNATRTQLLAAISAGDKALEEKITALAAALEAAVAAAEAADEALKVELNARIDEAVAALEAAIAAVAENLAQAQQELQEAIDAGDKKLHIRVESLGEAMGAALAAAQAADEALKMELNARIDQAVAALEAAIAQTQKNLDEVKAQLMAKDEQLAAKDAQLNTMVIVAIVLGGVGVCGCTALMIFLIVDKRKKVA